MCFHILVCIGLVNVVLCSLFIVAAVLVALVIVLALATEPYWFPGPVVEPHPTQRSIGSVGACPLGVNHLALALSAEHLVLFALLLVAHYRGTCRSRVVVVHHPPGYGTV
jgi:hypothetical protein